MIRKLVLAFTQRNAGPKPVGRWVVGGDWQRRADLATTDCVPSDQPRNVLSPSPNPPPTPSAPMVTARPLARSTTTYAALERFAYQMSILDDPVCMLVFETQAPSRGVACRSVDDVPARAA